MTHSSSIDETSAKPDKPPAGRASSNITPILRALLVVCAAAFVGLVAWSLRDTAPKEGSAAPSFSIRTDQGKEISVRSFGGKVLVLNFWASWCVPCVQEIPSLDQMQRRFAKDGLVVVAVSVDKNANKYHSFLNRIPVSFQTALDSSAAISEKYGTFQYPETYIIKDGKILRKYAAAEDWTSDDLTQYIQGLL